MTSILEHFDSYLKLITGWWLSAFGEDYSKIYHQFNVNFTGIPGASGFKHPILGDLATAYVKINLLVILFALSVAECIHHRQCVGELTNYLLSLLFWAEFFLLLEINLYCLVLDIQLHYLGIGILFCLEGNSLHFCSSLNVSLHSNILSVWSLLSYLSLQWD